MEPNVTTPRLRTPTDVARWLATNPRFDQRCDAHDRLILEHGPVAGRDIWEAGLWAAGHTLGFGPNAGDGR